MLKNFNDVIEKLRNIGHITIALAAAEDSESIEAIQKVASLADVKAILVGNSDKIIALCGPKSLPENFKIINEPSSPAAALRAASLVRTGEADILMKGLVNTSDFLRAVLNPEQGLRTGHLISHLAAFEVPGESKLMFHSDGGMVVSPGLEEKKAIISNALDSLHCLGIQKPNIAILAANERVDAKIPATTDAREIVDAWKRGEFPDCVIEGPIAMDVAASEEAAKHKGISSSIVGNVDLFIFPSIESGNIAGKILVHYAKAKMAGIILGAAKPIVLASRSDNSLTKVDSIALACLASRKS
ncbi:Phosphate butyryltransferase [uncultured spirochete]|uniref:Phosphate butyryltransferase n=1 Tax=uncultured spirochete TaxID=156406 RepID=A0A3P3XPL0_9SPIR|nr:Phosphate butyryltransferase [uncultured spirochete]